MKTEKLQQPALAGTTSPEGKEPYVAPSLEVIEVRTERGYAASGTFDGQGYTVSGLDINRASDARYVGLFGYLEGGTVKNLRVQGNITATESDDVGGIAGEIQNNSVIENCLFAGNVKGKMYVGGIAGYNYMSTITGCFSSGNVEAASKYAGGILGYNGQSNSPFSNCYSKASVIATKYAGGIVGKNNYTTVSSCYATGNVSAEIFAGGIAGDNYNATLKNCLALGTTVTRTSGTDTTFGRVAGENTDGNIPDCAAWEGMKLIDGTAPNELSGTSGIPGDNLTTDECKEKDTYTSRGFDESVWEFEGETFTTYLPWNKYLESKWPGKAKLRVPGAGN